MHANSSMTQQALTTSLEEAACLGGSTKELGGGVEAAGAEEAVLLGEALVVPAFFAVWALCSWKRLPLLKSWL